MLKKLRKILCCSAGDTEYGVEECIRPIRVSQNGNSEAELKAISKEEVQPDDSKIADKADGKATTETTGKASSTNTEHADGTVDTIVKCNTRGSLWKRAFDELDDDRKRHLPQEDEIKSPKQAIQEVISKTEESFKKYNSGGFKIKTQSGKEVNVRDMTKNILNSAMHCSDIVKGIVAFDATSYASSAWTIISFGLGMVKNYQDQQEAIYESSAFLANILARYSILESLYLKGQLQTQDAIVRVYKAILEYASEVNKRQEASRMKNIVNGIFPVSDTQLTTLKSTVKEQDQTVRDWSVVEDKLAQTELAEKALTRIENTFQNTETIKYEVDGTKRQRLLDWLSTTRYSQTQNDNQDIRSDQTGDWLLSSNEYLRWKATPGETLWLHGPAGCGKSILCSTVIKDLIHSCDVDNSKKCAYWYFQFSNQETQDVKQMTRSIIRQLVSEGIPASLFNLWKTHDGPNRDPDQEKLLSIFDEVLSSITANSTYIVLDALDEYPEQKNYGRRPLFTVFEQLMKHDHKVHLLVKSRFQEDIELQLHGETRLDLGQRINEDVERFIRKALEKEKFTILSQTVKDQIVQRLLETEER
ncbi:ATP-binding protein [Aspergillus melleus]|uniref:ATP-binding protein n=1 Tax=Aspergillus melleus TaxID=138277 RepID=UPI001E8DEF19|nr:uncharacterized protein LDX57_003265 [Aspergillus melleus]KAH8425514.1 hypothetical protein LDX57_003265 [Aspergillus melleus]